MINHNFLNSKLVSQRGMTLIEIMVAMVLGIFMIAGIGKIYSGSRQTNSMQESLSQIQENGRHALDLIAQEIRPAGFQGCPNLASVIPSINIKNSAPVINLANAIVGYDYVGTSISGYTVPSGVDNNTSILTLQRGGGCSDYLSTSMDGDRTAVLSISNDCGFEVDDILVVSDCKDTDIFIASTGTTSSSVTHVAGAFNSTVNFSKSYDIGAEVIKFQLREYYIKNESLYRRSIYYESGVKKTRDSQIAEGVDDMEIKYGVQTIGNTLAYLDAGDVSLWSKVVSVNIKLSLKSVDASTSQTIHKDFSTTIFLRNRA